MCFRVVQQQQLNQTTLKMKVITSLQTAETPKFSMCLNHVFFFLFFFFYVFFFLISMIAMKLNHLSQLVIMVLWLWYLSHRRQRRLRRDCAATRSHQSLRSSHTWSMEVDERSDQKSDIWPHWMAAHARLKNEFTEDEKRHNLMRWLILMVNRLKPFKVSVSF